LQDLFAHSFLELRHETRLEAWMECAGHAAFSSATVSEATSHSISIAWIATRQAFCWAHLLTLRACK